MGILTESMVRLRDEVTTLRQKRSLALAELVRGTAERRAGVIAMRTAFTRDRALAHRSWFGPTAAERRAVDLERVAELQKKHRLAEEASKALAHAEQNRRLAAEAKALARAEHDRKLAEEAKAFAQAEHDRKLAEQAKEAKEAKARIEAELKATPAEETVPTRAVPHAAPERTSSDRHPATSQRKAAQHKASQHKASKTHGSK